MDQDDRPEDGGEARRLQTPSGRPANLPGLSEEEAVGGVLRWLLFECEAEATLHLALGRDGQEDVRVEPRGLDAEVLGRLVADARDALVQWVAPEAMTHDVHLVRWLGAGGPKVLAVLRASSDPSEAMRFARFALELAQTSRPDREPHPLEGEVRRIRDVLWAEVEEEGAGLRAVVTADADREEVLRAIGEVAGELPVRLERAGSPRTEEPRARLVDVAVSDNGGATAEVLIDWQGQKLRGRGLGRPSTAGRMYAAAQAVADAMKPLIEGDLAIEGVFQADVGDGAEMVVVAIRVAEERFVGAVVTRPSQHEMSGARAVLDALNRRLPHIAGRSGRI